MASYTDQITTGKYGVQESNPIVAGYHDIERSESVALTDPRLRRVTRLRLISDVGVPAWDVSYCHGILKDGTECRVILPVGQLPKRNLQRAIVQMCKDAKVFGKSLGLLDPSTISVCQ